jgi:hypothetical protein
MGAELCRIERWRGYVASSFYVRLPDRTVLESQPFRWRRAAAPPQTGSALVAYEELVARLERAGWARYGDGVDWFGTTFVRVVEARPGLVPAAPPVGIVAPPPPAPPPLPPSVVERPAASAPPPSAERPAAPAEAARAPAGGERRRRWPVPVGAAAALVVTAVASILLLRGGGDATAHARGSITTTPPATTAVAPPPAQTSTPAPEPTPTKTISGLTPARTVLVDLHIDGHRNGSWTEVRRNSATGAILYSATLGDGQSLHLRGRKLWTRFGAASNLTITANGRPVQLQGTIEKLFVAPS